MKKLILVWWLFLSLLGLDSFAQSARPTLRMISSNNVVTALWPGTAYFYFLQSATNLSPTAQWTNEATASSSLMPFSNSHFDGNASLITNVFGEELLFGETATQARKFYRLNPPLFILPCTFAVFYNGPLEFTYAGAMEINGPVHANGPIYVGTPISLAFNQTVTTTETISSPMRNGVGPWTTNDWNTVFNSSPAFVTNVIPLVWAAITNDPHQMIEVPPATENPANSGILRFYDDARIVFQITNGPLNGDQPTVTLIMQSADGQLPGADPHKSIWQVTNASPANLATNFPFLTLASSFYDRREQKTNIVTQIDIGRYATWVATNTRVQIKLTAAIGLYPTIMYVADCRTNAPQQLPVVRLVNGAQLPSNNNYGFTVVTKNPLYVLGDYNIRTRTSGTNQSVSTTNTAYAAPAALISDALTILASTWSDSLSFSPYSPTITAYNAVDTTINAAIITGTVASTGTSDTTFSGGVHNLPRLLQDWSGKNLWLNTSIIRFWQSEMATNQYRNPSGFVPAPIDPYYNSPTRHISLDPNFLDLTKYPPGIPVILVDWPTNR